MAENIKTYRTNRRPEPNIKISDTPTGARVPVDYVTIKKPRRNVAGAATGDSEYAGDPQLQAALIDYCRAAGYPLAPGKQGELDRTMRVPVNVLRNSLDETFDTRRAVHNGAGYFCCCGSWRLKTPEEARADHLPYDDLSMEEYIDDWQYHIGEARRQNWVSQQRQFGDKKVNVQMPDGAAYPVVCNPLSCPFANKPHGDKTRCKLSGTIYLQARGWSSDPIRVETTSWETNSRFPAAWDIIAAACGGLLLGAPLDLVLNYSRSKPTPDGSKRPRPFWTLELPYGMDAAAARRAALAGAQSMVEDYEAALALAQRYNAVTLASRSPQALAAHEGATDDLLPALPGQTTAEVIDAVAYLINRYGKTEAEAKMLVSSNIDDLPALYARLGEPTINPEIVMPDEPDVPDVPDAPTPEQGQIGEPVVEPEQETEPEQDTTTPEVETGDDGIIEGEFDTEENASIPFLFSNVEGVPDIATMKSTMDKMEEQKLFNLAVVRFWLDYNQTDDSTILPEIDAVYDVQRASIEERLEKWWARYGYKKHVLKKEKEGGETNNGTN